MSDCVSAPRLGAEFFDRPVVEVARDLIGCTLVHGPTSGTIVETEAYHQSEAACHAYRGPTPRARTLFDSPGTTYVYLSYGVHSLFNVVAEREGTGAAVLLRALAPLDGVQTMRRRRGRNGLGELCSGPGKLTQALAIGLKHNGIGIATGPISILARPGALQGLRVAESRRIGISLATELPWRFTAAESPFLSK